MKLKYILGGALPFIKVTMMVSALEQSCTTDLESQKSICPESLPRVWGTFPQKYTEGCYVLYCICQ